MIKFAVNTILCATHYCTLPFSDGMSRSGVFITCMSEIERVKVEGAVDIFQTVKAARAQRPHMVYTSVSDAWHEIICTSRSNTRNLCIKKS